MFDDVYFYCNDRLKEQFDEDLLYNARGNINILIWDSLKGQLQHHIYNQLKEDC